MISKHIFFVTILRYLFADGQIYKIFIAFFEAVIFDQFIIEIEGFKCANKCLLQIGILLDLSDILWDHLGIHIIDTVIIDDAFLIRIRKFIYLDLMSIWLVIRMISFLGFFFDAKLDFWFLACFFLYGEKITDQQHIRVLLTFDNFVELLLWKIAALQLLFESTAVSVIRLEDIAYGAVVDILFEWNCI